MSKTVKPFLSNGFLLENETSTLLYDQYAASMPIIDYHCHLSPKDIAENRKFNNLTECWLEGDHYKWRAMRTNGVNEKFCTGDAAPFDKFMKWAETVPYTMRNPLYHWTHLELKNYFGISKILNQDSAKDIYNESTGLLQQEDFRVWGLLKRMKVEIVCTTDDPTDSLEYHRQYAHAGGPLKMFPTFRPDKAFAIENPKAYLTYLKRFSEVTGKDITSVAQLLEALKMRIGYFASLGARASDHGLQSLYYEPCNAHQAEQIFEGLKSGKPTTEEQTNQFKFYILAALAKMYRETGWVQQFHVGAMRNNSSRMMRELGPDTGFDSIGDYPQAQAMASFFDHLDNANQLANTIIYNHNPADNELFATMTGNFNDGSFPGKMQFGSGWWFLDQKDGMEKQINALSNMGLLSRFVGMLTDSRSFLSFPRHEYFRRILCNLLGRDVENGELPNDIPWIGKMVQDICYHNAKNYFGF